MQSHRAMTSLGSQRHSGLTHMARMLRWMHPGPLGRTCQDDGGELPFLAKDHPKCTGTGGEAVRSCLMRITIIVQTNTTVCHRPHDQEDIDEALSSDN